MRLAGSSPRARGTCHRHRGNPGGVWLIPAGAGNIRTRCTRSGTRRAHPRGRGEHFGPTAEAKDPRGSSPRARGTWCWLGVLSRRGGLIPAGAGNMVECSRRITTPRAHPRGRGEHGLTEDAAKGELWLIPAGAGNMPPFPPPFVGGLGSSPRARGTCHPIRQAGGHDRLIPAGAGNMTPGPWIRDSDEAHPRGRGEHQPIFKAPARFQGSSPRARGTSVQVPPLVEQARLIPAGAGNIAVITGRATHYSGSSPRARGTSCSRPGSPPEQRLIPAGAGNIVPSASRTCCEEAHPRGRGEHLRIHLDGVDYEWLIPAGAGNIQPD